MSLQNLFYIIAIVFMTVGIFVLIIIGYVVFVIKRNITHAQRIIEEKMDALTKSAGDPLTIALSAGMKTVKTAVKKVKKTLSR